MTLVMTTGTTPQVQNLNQPLPRGPPTILEIMERSKMYRVAWLKAKVIWNYSITFLMLKIKECSRIPIILNTNLTGFEVAAPPQVRGS